MEVTRIDYNIADYKYQKGQSFYENCDPPKAIAMFQAMCQEHNYPFVITNWAWFSRLGTKA